MSVLGLDWNATRVRAVVGEAGEYPLALPLEPPHYDLPLAISFEKGGTEFGSSALRLCRHSSHLVCHSFLPYLSVRAGQGPRWHVGKQTLDARQACELFWRQLQLQTRACQSVVLCVPGYLQAAQAEALRSLGEKARSPVLGSVPATLAAAMAGYSEQFWQNSVVVADVDEYALTLGLVRSVGDKAQLIDSRSFSHLGLRFWKERLINSLADLFVWQHRVDPRDSSLAEQHLYDQLDVLIDAAAQRQALQLGLQGQQWFKHLLVQPQQTEMICEALTRQAIQETEHMLSSWPSESQPRGILLTQQAGRLPGFVDALQALVRRPLARPKTQLGVPMDLDEEDFGDDLLNHQDVEELAGVFILPAEALARSAHGLVPLFRKGILPAGHLETMAPLPGPLPVDSGPARLHFQGRDYLLHERVFFLGSHYDCHLRFDRYEHPDVAPQHCNINFDHRAFVLHNLSPDGTLVNDLPIMGTTALRGGDRIRLGYRGPVLRFLGRSIPQPLETVGS